MSDAPAPQLPKWPFYLGDGLLVGVACLIYWQGKGPMGPWEIVPCAAAVALGAVLAVIPHLMQYRAAVKLAEADRLAEAVQQIQNLETVGRQITAATGNWQTAHEHAVQAVTAAREITERISGEAKAFTEFLQKANDAEKQHLRLEVEKLRRGEAEWLQILIRMLDHVFALYQAAVRSGHASLVEQLGQFQNACRDVARRVGLVPFVAVAGEVFNSRLHQIAQGDGSPPADAKVGETVATGYSFQGQIVRPALVTLKTDEPPAATGFPDDAGLATEPALDTEKEFVQEAAAVVDDLEPVAGVESAAESEPADDSFVVIGGPAMSIEPPADAPAEGDAASPPEDFRF